MNLNPNSDLERYPSTTITIKETVTVLNAPIELTAVICKENTFVNPKYEANERNDRSNWNTQRLINTYQSLDGGIVIPIGYLKRLIEICDEFELVPKIEDIRTIHPVKYPEMKGVKLRSYQQNAVNAAMESCGGVIISPTGSGKTVIGLEIIRKRKQKALILVHRSDLGKQWLDVIWERMGIKAGFIGEGSFEIGEQITVAMIQTLSSKEEETRKISDTFGLILCEETHHCPMSTCFDVLNLLSAKFRYGLSATLNRSDRLEPIIYLAVGNAIATISKEEVENMGGIVPVSVVSIKTKFNPGFVSSWSDYLDKLTYSAERNFLIIELARKEAVPVLILCDRIAHLNQLSEMLSRRNIKHVIAHGKLKSEARLKAMQELKTSHITLGTTGLLGEGLDVSSWGVLIMASPISSEIKLMQSIGRIVRPAIGKEKAIAYDLRDDCGFSGSSFNKRKVIYEKHGIRIKFT